MILNDEKYIDDLASSIRFILNAKRGKFYPNKNFGSLISTISQEPSVEYALAYARQAVDDVDGVYVKSAKKDNDKYIFSLIINGYEREVDVLNDNILQ